MGITPRHGPGYNGYCDPSVAKAVAGYSGYGSSPRDSPSISPATVAERGLGHHNDENNNSTGRGSARWAPPKAAPYHCSRLRLWLERGRDTHCSRGHAGG